MKRTLKDLLWLLGLLVVAVIMLTPSSRNAFLTVTKAHPYIMGFIKVSILATMGELLAMRILNADWKAPTGLLYRFIIWGFFGLAFACVFPLFDAGVTGIVKAHLIPGVIGSANFGDRLLIAFYSSAFMNLIFAPVFMAFHRVTDTIIDLGEGKLGKMFSVKLGDAAKKIDWSGFITFVVVKTIPIFWIPAHTFNFMLPKDYRVLVAALLSVALGGILAFAKKGATVKAPKGVKVGA